jgi:hypothetical protein
LAAGPPSGRSTPWERWFLQLPIRQNRIVGIYLGDVVCESLLDAHGADAIRRLMGRQRSSTKSSILY